MLSTARILTTITQACFEAKNYILLNENINTLAKRRGQLKGAVVKMVQAAQLYIDQLETEELKYELIDTLRSVTEGKVINHIN
jgi:26S proteasome regulatory subunit N5